MLNPVPSFDELKKLYDQRAMYEYIFRVHFRRRLPEIEDMVISPLRHETNGSFKLFVSRYGELAWVDHGLAAQRRYGYDALGLYRAYRAEVVKRPRSYQEALHYMHSICLDQNFHAPEPLPPVQKQKPMYVRFTRNLGQFIDFWEQFGFDREFLLKYQVFLATEVYANGQKVAKTTAKNPVYVYLFTPLGHTPPSWQSYQPKKKKGRFFSSNVGLMGWNQLPESGEHIVLTSSYKDLMVLANCGLPALATGSEKTLQNIPMDIIEELQERFKHTHLLLDNDKTGREVTQLMMEDHPHMFNIEIPSDWAKDPADIVIEQGYQDLLALLPQ